MHRGLAVTAITYTHVLTDETELDYRGATRLMRGQRVDHTAPPKVWFGGPHVVPAGRGAQLPRSPRGQPTVMFPAWIGTGPCPWSIVSGVPVAALSVNVKQSVSPISDGITE